MDWAVFALRLYKTLLSQIVKFPNFLKPGFAHTFTIQYDPDRLLNL